MTNQSVTDGRPPLKEFLADPSWQFAVVAHRGAWHGAPENSIDSVELAINNGYEFVEIDVQATADGELVCLHDDTLERMTGQSGIVSQTKAADITCLFLKEGAGGEGAPFSSSRPPLLPDLLSVTGDRIYVDVDVKHFRDLEKVAAFVKDHPSRHHINLKTVVESEADMRFVDELEQKTGVLVKPIVQVTAETLGVYLGFLQQRSTPLVEGLFDSWSSFELYAKAAQVSGTNLFLNSLDEVPSAEVTDTQSLADPDLGWGRLVEQGVRLIQTDKPNILKEYSRKRSAIAATEH
ncbi:MAG: glycerophosphodiester phosphodiesterase family protein [Pseudomonadota bacterium]